jgi:hypothetical protein
MIRIVLLQQWLHSLKLSNSVFVLFQIHWFSIFNSFMMVIFLVGLVSMILMRTLRKDYARYSKDEELDDMVRSMTFEKYLVGYKSLPAWHTKSHPKWKLLRGIYSGFWRAKFTVSQMCKVCWSKGRLYCNTAKLFNLKVLVRPETFGPYYVRLLDPATFVFWTPLLTSFGSDYVHLFTFHA